MTFRFHRPDAPAGDLEFASLVRPVKLSDLGDGRQPDDQTATRSSWDDDKPPLDSAALQWMGFDLNLSGFSADELQRLLG